MPHNKGMDWIKLPKRLAIYVRDSFDCVWCRGVFPIDPLGYGLTLDHLDSTKGNYPENLVTCCRPCNSAKRDIPLNEWYDYLTTHGYNIRSIKRRIQHLTHKPINLTAGKQLAITRRPSYRKRYSKGTEDVNPDDERLTNTSKYRF